MKVLTIISRLGMGGIEKTLLSCLPFLKENGIQMSVLCSLGGQMDEDFKSLGVELIDLGPSKKPFKDAQFLKKLLLTQKFDVVHSRHGHTSGLFAKVCHDFNIPFLVSIHNERAMFRNDWIGKPFFGFLRSLYLSYHKKLTLKYATKIIGHSKANLRYFTDKVDDLPVESQFQVLYNGVDFSKFHDYPCLSLADQQNLDSFIEGAKKVFLHVGSFKEQKNHFFLMNVFSKLHALDNSFRLILLGGGELLDDVMSYAAELGIKENILFAGIQTNIAPYLYFSDIFVFPSLYEGFGNVLIEAQYVGLPVAASVIPPHFEATAPGYHKFLYDPLDVNDATNKITDLLKQADIENEIAEGKLYAKNFSVNNMVNNLMDIYRTVTK